ncbi:glycoside hydrolase family 3 N-terminal domain-containing protein [Cellulomonas cellasea]|uniref:Beta-N-acetylhexosaminidase n=1 Tax=Cellulomonas cellasea TaxID=43670 RepID=A0A7W4YDL1_9CELL|nr:glycoside hydrolase family 3 N-terminal domain-containing protein [Cellulomonas cellasea]MBB2925284.1 beta-N-acetylhexosaminidase [Cellulomonas cellasea]
MTPPPTPAGPVPVPGNAAPRHARPSRWAGRVRAVALAGLAVACLGAGSVGAAALADGTDAPVATPAPDPVAAAPSPTPTPEPTPTCTPAPLEQRAAATLVVGLPGVRTAADPLAQEVVGLGVGGVFLSESNVGTATQVAALSAGLRTAAGRPLLVSTDEESGRVALMRDVVGEGPSPRRMAQRETPEAVRARAAETGAALAGVGVDLDLAPVLDLDDGPAGGVIGDRSFSADPATAADYGLAYAAGLADAGVTPTMKHFPGHGRSTVDSHETSSLVTATVDELAATDLLPFQRAIDAGAPVIMLNHLQYAALDPDRPASLSPRAYALLRDMGFEGVAITDSVGMGAVNLRWDFPVAAVEAVGAGADAVLTTDGRHAAAMRDALVDAVRTGRLPEERLSEAAARVTALAGGDPVAMSCLDVELPAVSRF